jgi:hypothetical protein
LPEGKRRSQSGRSNANQREYFRLGGPEEEEGAVCLDGGFNL